MKRGMRRTFAQTSRLEAVSTPTPGYSLVVLSYMCWICLFQRVSASVRGDKGAYTHL